MELISVILGAVFWLAVIAAWVWRCRQRHIARTTCLLVLFALIVLPAPGAYSVLKWLFLDEPLLEAAQVGDVAKIDRLLARGANINTEQAGMTPLMEAIQSGVMPAVQDLVEKGANVNARNASGETPLSIAIGCRRNDIVIYLQNAGAK